MKRILAEVSPNEHDLALRWRRLPLPIDLPLSDGGTCRLLHAGRAGGPQGPDIRDAVLKFEGEPGQTEQTGDIEFHVRCSDWYAHQHESDPRYNNVILHVVLIYDTSSIQRQDGHFVPICSLLDLVPSVPPFEPVIDEGQRYPCERIMPTMSESERAEVLHLAGIARFKEKTRNLLAQLREARPHEPFSAFDTVLVPALAEALGYGRDRAFFRAAGLRLVGLIDDRAVPEPLGRAPKPSPLDTDRLRALGELVEQWRDEGAWKTIRRSLYDLRSIFSAIGTSRSDILICNVILPFAVGVALLKGDDALEAQARDLYERYPALSSNQVTRAMRQQLHIEREPRNACQQQGLQHIYAQTCREKRCDACLVAHWRERS